MERKEAIEIVRKLYNESLFMKKDKEAMVTLIPELKESEDERIRKALINVFSTHQGYEVFFGASVEDILAWLEKQGEKKPADKVEPKFKVGDWITNGEYIWKVTGIGQLDYILQSQNGDTVDDTISYVDEYFHLWTIQDAKDGC